MTRAVSKSSGAAAAALAQPAPLWILNSWRDLLLFVATPLLIIPALRTAELHWNIEQISLFVASFGAMGHHFPGLLRAYGDRALFERFRTRFLLAPVFLLTVAGLFGYLGLSGVLVIAFFWGVWHALMQTYGFVRIYDSKKGSYSLRTCRLDFVMCVVWFGLVVLWSPTRLPDVLGLLYKSGIPPIPGSILDVLRTGWAALAAVATALFLLNLGLLWRHGRKTNLVKVLLMATSFGFFWYANVAVSNILLGIALFEIFHDVQYLSIVWLFNRNRVKKDRTLPGFTRFLFRQSPALLGLYVGLVFGYGALNLIPRGIPDDAIKDTIMGLLTASGLLHFYYDGFIWKVRESGVRQSLGLKAEAAGSTPGGSRPGWQLHCAKWMLFVAPVLWLGISESVGRPAEVERRRAISDALPENAVAAYDLGSALGAQGRITEAEEQYRRAVALDPEFAEAYNNLGAASGSQGRYDEALRCYDRALTLRPRYPEAHNNLGIALAAVGRPAEAIEHYREALKLKPDYAEVHNNLGTVLASMGRNVEAAAHFGEAIRYRPDYPEAHGNLGVALFSAGSLDQAIKHFSAAVESRPADPELHFRLGLALEARGSAHQASAQYIRALELQPGHLPARESLARLQGR
jgi:Flp pilus assembly protein TadD